MSAEKGVATPGQDWDMTMLMFEGFEGREAT